MIISLKNAVKKYGSGEALVYALDHAELTLDEGEISVILGPSGSGKSTLLNMLGGLDTLDEGDLTVAGRKVSGLSREQRTDYRKQDVGFVFQFYNLISDLTVEENIEVVADISHKPLAMDEVLHALDIEKYRRRFPKELSGGQQQRVAIARAIAQAPPIILADEPTGNLDSGSTKEIMEILKGLHEEGRTVILITHDNDIAAQAKRVIKIMDGRIVSDTADKDKEQTEEPAARGEQEKESR